MQNQLKDEDQNLLDELMQEGYALSMAGKNKAAVEVWLKLWKKMTDVMDAYQIESMEDMDQAFRGSQFISNWAMDFEVELSNASEKDKSFTQKKIDFCTEYLARTKDKDDLNSLVLKRVIAEAHFQLGNPEEGDRLFEQYVEEHPTDGWGWINWSDQYGLFAEKGNRNVERAIQILKQGLSVDGVEDRIDILERLEGLHTELGMTEEASQVRQKIKEGKEKEDRNRSRGVEEIAQKPRQMASPKPKKVGRNEPCPCGSGKKYKKCCGK